MSDDESAQFHQGFQTLSAAEPFTFFAPVEASMLDRIYALEKASYPEDEAATYEKLKLRIEKAPNAFMVALQAGAGSGAPDELVGFVCGTQTSAGKLTHESMSQHDADGDLLCVHSVVVEASRRRKGLATRMLKAYLQYVQSGTPQLKGVRLLCKKDLISLYAGVGFRDLGVSDVVHGQDPWHEMALEVDL